MLRTSSSACEREEKRDKSFWNGMVWLLVKVWGHFIFKEWLIAGFVGMRTSIYKYKYIYIILYVRLKTTMISLWPVNLQCFNPHCLHVCLSGSFHQFILGLGVVASAHVHCTAITLAHLADCHGFHLYNYYFSTFLCLHSHLFFLPILAIHLRLLILLLSYSFKKSYVQQCIISFIKSI